MASPWMLLAVALCALAAVSNGLPQGENAEIKSLGAFEKSQGADESEVSSVFDGDEAENEMSELSKLSQDAGAIRNDDLGDTKDEAASLASASALAAKSKDAVKKIKMQEKEIAQKAVTKKAIKDASKKAAAAAASSAALDKDEHPAELGDVEHDADAKLTKASAEAKKMALKANKAIDRIDATFNHGAAHVLSIEKQLNEFKKQAEKTQQLAESVDDVSDDDEFDSDEQQESLANMEKSQRRAMIRRANNALKTFGEMTAKAIDHLEATMP